jgi:methionyl-tRNA formyltransferase
MRYVFFGTPHLAATVLEALLDAGMPPVAVVCNPDRPAGRGKVITAPPVKRRIMNYELGIKNKIKILQPEKLDEHFINSLFSIHTSWDFFVVTAYAKIIPKSILSIPRLGVIGVHPSLLPRYRGPSPIKSALLAGEAETGVTLYLVDEKTDHGPILAQNSVPIAPDDTDTTLSEKLARTGGKLLAETLPRFTAGEITPQPQDEKKATLTKKFTSQDGFVEPAVLRSALSGKNPQAARRIENMVRALGHEPGVWTLQEGLPAGRQGKRLKLLEAKVENEKTLKLLKTQKEGKKPGLAREL